MGKKRKKGKKVVLCYFPGSCRRPVLCVLRIFSSIPEAMVYVDTMHDTHFMDVKTEDPRTLVVKTARICGKNLENFMLHLVIFRK